MRGIRSKKRREKAAVDTGAPGFAAEARPYRRLASFYDELVGDSAYDCWKENFDRLVARYGIGFEIAADIACGTGHAAGYIAGMCRKVYAVDISPEMLAAARSRLKGRNVTFLEQSFTSLELPEQVNLLTCNFDSLNYLVEDEEIEEAILRFGRSVARGGHCIFDMNTTRELEVEWGTAVFLHRISSGFAVWESDWDPQSRINTLRMTNFIKREDGLYAMSEELHRERSYEMEYILELLERAGFCRVEAWDAKGLTGVGNDTRRVQFLARKSDG